MNGLSVRENVMVGLDEGVGLLGPVRLRRGYTSKVERVDELLADMDLSDVAELPADSLPYGVQRRVEITRALATKPRLLLLDEPVAGMNDAEIRVIGELLVRLRSQGMTIVLVEHHLDMIMSASDHLVVLDFGKCIAAGPPTEVAGLPAVREAYFGKERHGAARG